MAQNWNFTLDKGSTKNIQLSYKDSNRDPYDLTGFTAKMQIRESYTSSTALITLSTETAGIEIPVPTNGKIYIEFLPADTASISNYSRDYVYDLEITSGSFVKRLIEGKVTIMPEVTQ